MSNDSFNLDAPPGFRGLHPDIPVTMYERHLPHWRQDGATYFVTFQAKWGFRDAKHDLRSVRRPFHAVNLTQEDKNDVSSQ